MYRVVALVVCRVVALVVRTGWLHWLCVQGGCTGLCRVGWCVGGCARLVLQDSCNWLCVGCVCTGCYMVGLPAGCGVHGGCTGCV